MLYVKNVNVKTTERQVRGKDVLMDDFVYK